MLRIGVDIRGLNDSHFTGVNTYILHTLWEMYQHKPTSWEIIGIGLKADRKDDLWSRFPFLKDLFTSTQTLQEYYGLPIPHKLLQLYSLALPLSSSVTDIDILYLPQPRLLTKHPKTKSIVNFHDVYFALHPDTSHVVSPTKRLLDNPHSYRRVIQNSDKVFTVSLSTAIDLQKHLHTKKEKISWVYPGYPHWNFDTEKNEEEISIPTQPYILALSGLEWRKNSLNMLLAHKKAQQDTSYTSHLVFAGFPTQKKFVSLLQKTIQKLAIERVIFIEAPLNSQKKALIAHSQALLYPSWYEGFGFPILEAFAEDKPVIFGIYGSGYEVAGSAGIPVNPGIIDEIVFALKTCSDPQNPLYNEIQSEIKNKFSAYTWKEWFNQFERAIIALTKEY